MVLNSLGKANLLYKLLDNTDLPQILVPHVKLGSQAFFISQFRYASGAGGR